MRQLITNQQLMLERARLRPGTYRGRLAEPYDGIGQYVLVNLAGSSVAAAYKARVASGDFATGRIFPRGTPVTLVDHRGNLEVFLGSQGCKPKLLQYEYFNRSVSLGSSWGTSEFQGNNAWFDIGPGTPVTASVDGSAALYTVGSDTSLDQAVRVDAKLPTDILLAAKFVNENSNTLHSIRVSLRDNDGSSLPNAIITLGIDRPTNPASDTNLFIQYSTPTTGMLIEELVVIPKPTIDKYFWIRFEVGDTARGKVWEDGDPEPSLWQVEINTVADLSTTLQPVNYLRINFGGTNRPVGAQGYVSQIEFYTLCRYQFENAVACWVATQEATTTNNTLTFPVAPAIGKSVVLIGYKTAWADGPLTGPSGFTKVIEAFLHQNEGGDVNNSVGGWVAIWHRVIQSGDSHPLVFIGNVNYAWGGEYPCSFTVGDSDKIDDQPNSTDVPCGGTITTQAGDLVIGATLKHNGTVQLNIVPDAGTTEFIDYESGNFRWWWAGRKVSTGGSDSVSGTDIWQSRPYCGVTAAFTPS